MLGTTPVYINDIDTVPSSLGNILVTGYSPLTVNAAIEDYPYRCQWEYGANFETRIVFFERFTECYSQADVTCVIEDSMIISTLTLTEPLSKGTLNIRVNCEFYEKALPTITVQGTVTVMLQIW